MRVNVNLKLISLVYKKFLMITKFLNTKNHLEKLEIYSLTLVCGIKVTNLGQHIKIDVQMYQSLLLFIFLSPGIAFAIHELLP